MTTSVTGSCYSKYSFLGDLANQTVQYVKPTSLLQPDCLIRRIRQTSYRVTKLVHPEATVLGKISTFTWLNGRGSHYDDRRINVQVQNLKPTLSYASPKKTTVFKGVPLNFTSKFTNGKTCKTARSQQTWSPLFPDLMMRYN